MIEVLLLFAATALILWAMMPTVLFILAVLRIIRKVLLFFGPIAGGLALLLCAWVIYLVFPVQANGFLAEPTGQ